MTPNELTRYLTVLIENQLQISLMIWGAPGIGKSSIAANVAQMSGMELIDLRLSQLAPTDLRGLPVAENGVSRWFPPEFLPTSGQGILFLDEINMAPPAMQGVAQQLILDRKIGGYTVPQDWFIWAAGNRKQDRAAVFEMPAPLANRFAHLEVECDFDSFKAWALDNGIHEQILAFLSYRKNLLHKVDPKQPNWPSPRSWGIASKLHTAGLSVASSVGNGPAAEFNAFVSLYAKMPEVEPILSGNNKLPAFPDEPSMRYALIIALLTRLTSGTRALNALRYLAEQAPAEWVQLFAADAIPAIRKSGKLAELAALLHADPVLQDFMKHFKEIMSSV